MVPHHGTFLEENCGIQPAPVLRFSRTPSAIQRPPARPDEHTAEALRDWASALRIWSGCAHVALLRARPGRSRQPRRGYDGLLSRCSRFFPEPMMGSNPLKQPRSDRQFAFHPAYISVALLHGRED